MAERTNQVATAKEATADLSATQRALLAARLRGSKDVGRLIAMEPIAIIGMGCRFPGGADDPASFWKLLVEGRDAVAEPSAERWPESADRTALGRGGYLKQIDHFDPAFFGISPREAREMDPQQRLLFEVTWEALERAGLPRQRLAGTSGGVFVGMYNSDYSMLSLLRPEELHDAHLSVGFSAAANRLSYMLDLHGPSLVVDTACSSALLAVHLACQSLRSGESSTAIAAGVNLVLRPELSETYRRWGMLAPDGRCKVFDARADGYVRGEGCGVVVLQRLSDALAAGSPVLALIYGSASGQDGRTQSITAPNGKAQADVLGRALAQAGIAPEQVSYVEAHGTGTSLGDPIEFEAIRGVYGRERTCFLGAVKANIGHLEAASGMAGLIKTVLALQHEAIPAQVHYTSPNPHLGIEATSFRIPTALTPWTSPSPRYAGLSSFGAGGTNLHVILAEATPPQRSRVDDATPRLFTLSARDGRALESLTQATAAHVADPAHRGSLRDLCHTANVARTHLEHRVAIVATSRAELAEKLRSLSAGSDDATRGEAMGGPPRIVFVFSGQGGQWAGMGRRLLATNKTFRAAVEACDAELRAAGGRSVLAVLESGDPGALEAVDVVQPALFALQVALAASWAEMGIKPDAVVGHSMGEVAAAYVAGALSLTDAAKVIHTRSHLLASIRGQGAMALLGVSLAQANAALRGRESQLSIAASNHPTATVISGDPSAIDAVITELASTNVFARRVKVDVASHSAQVEPLLADLVRSLATIKPHAESCPIVSTVTGDALEGEGFDASYWAQNLRRPVLFGQAIERLRASGHDLFVEIGPHPVLDASEGVTLVPSMRRDEDESRVMLEALGGLHVRGAAVDWRALDSDAGPIVALPAYPWQRDRYWLDGLATLRTGTSSRSAPLVRCAPVWKPVVRRQEAALGPGSWLVLHGGGAGGASVLQALRAHGTDVSSLHFQELSNRATLAGVLDAPGAQRSTVVLVAEEADDDVATGTRGLRAALDVVRALAGAKGLAPRLWIVTRGAASLDGPRTDVGLRQAPLAGFLRSLAHEHPELLGGLVDLDPARTAETQAEDLLHAMSEPAGQHLAVRGRDLHRETLEELPALSLPSTFSARGAGTYLVTGGLGGLGLHVVRWLVEHGARRLVLAGRRAPSADAIAVISEVTQKGASVRVERLDVADEAALETLLRAVPELCGVIHAAGVLDDALLARATWEQYARVLEPKVRGAWNLHRATAGRDLDFFVLFSSSASVLGSAGQAHYAAANAFLDALAHHRRACGQKALSVSWGAWAGAGMVSAGEGERLHNVAAYGLQAMEPREALASLERELAGPAAHVAVLRVDWKTFAARFPRGEVLAVLFELVPLDDGSSLSVPFQSDNPWLTKLRELGETERLAALTDFVRDHVVDILGFTEKTELDPRRGLFELGMTSLMAVDLRRRLQRAVGGGVSLRSTLVFDYPSAVALAGYLATTIVARSGTNTHESPVQAPLARVEEMSDDHLRRMLLGDEE